MSVSVQNVGRFRTNGTVLGSRNLEADTVANTVYVPYNVLVEQSRSGIVKTVLFAYKGLEHILDSTNVVLTTNKELMNDNDDLELVSRVTAVSFGRRRRLQYPDTVDVTLNHIDPSTTRRPVVCVSWNPELAFWTDAGCSLIQSDDNETVCRCDRTGMFALASARQAGAGSSGHLNGSAAGISLVTLQIVTYIVATISVICVLLILVKVNIYFKLKFHIKAMKNLIYYHYFKKLIFLKMLAIHYTPRFMI